MAKIFGQPGKTGIENLKARKVACKVKGKICHDSIDCKRRKKMKINSIIFCLCAGMCSSTLLDSAFSMDGQNILPRSFHKEKGKLGPYHMMIASKYFESIDDFKNLEFATPKAYKNADKWHMNPIPIKPEQLRYFPNLETLHLYTQREIDIWKSYYGDTKKLKKIEVWKQYPDIDAKAEYQHLKRLVDKDGCSIAGVTFHNVILRRPYYLGEFDDSGKFTFNKNVYTGGPRTYANFEITIIDTGSFTECTRLTSIIIPDTVKSIRSWAFSECIGLKSIIIPSKVKVISWNAFDGCTGLTSIILENGVKSIGERTFRNCISLKSITIPDTFEWIVDNAFVGCTGLTSVTIPDSVRSIGDHAFERSTKTIFTVASEGMKYYLNSVHHIDKYRIIIDTSLANKDENMWRWTLDGHVKIPNGTTIIGNNMLRNRKDITRITIPNSVQSIGDGVFNKCTRLTSIKIPYKVTSIGEFSFSDCSRLTAIHIPNNVQFIGISAFENCVKLQSIKLSTRITEIASFTFYGCSSLSAIDIPNSVQYINLKSFDGCIGLKSIEIPYGVIQIGSSVFRGCTGLSSITLPNSISYIFRSAFEDCVGLTSITIPASVKSIDDNVFRECTGLSKIYVYSNEMKQMVIDKNKSGINSDIIEVLEGQKDKGK